MRFHTSSLLGLCGVLSATAISSVYAEETTQEQDTTFWSVRPDLAKQYDSEPKIPDAKYFSKRHLHYPAIPLNLPNRIEWFRLNGRQSDNRTDCELLTDSP